MRLDEASQDGQSPATPGLIWDSPRPSLYTRGPRGRADLGCSDTSGQRCRGARRDLPLSARAAGLVRLQSVERRKTGFRDGGHKTSWASAPPG